MFKEDLYREYTLVVVVMVAVAVVVSKEILYNNNKSIGSKIHKIV
jgi:hypothetical protein